MLPLESVTIVSLEQYGAGPFATMHLADLGATVIKIEDPSVKGDIARWVPPFQQDDTSLFFESFNRNKQSISLNITTPAGIEVLHDLVRTSDAVFSNLRGDVPEKIGITYDQLKHINPAIVCCSLSGYGQTGPRALDPGYDYMLQALTGWMSLTGEPDGPPTKSGLSLVDFSGGLVAATAILAGVTAARKTGIGTDCDLSLYDTALGMLTYVATWEMSGEFSVSRTHHSAHPTLVPFQVFQSKDSWLVVGCAKEKFWVRLASVLKHPELATDSKYDSFAARFENKAELLPILENIFKQRTNQEWILELRAAGVPCGEVNSVSEALTDSHTIARDMVIKFDHPVFGEVSSVASPVKVGSTRITHKAAPKLNQDQKEILKNRLNYSEEKIAELANNSAFEATTTTKESD
jgi:crotonobetainyl-CoA:carnitine CoA-transferase CaiB-like acyl-CoA transferase